MLVLIKLTYHVNIRHTPKGKHLENSLPNDKKYAILHPCATLRSALLK